MHGREQRVLLRHYLEQGLTKSAIAERLGVDRTTIYRWIRSGQLDRDLDEDPVRYAPRPPVPGSSSRTKPSSGSGSSSTRSFRRSGFSTR